MTTEALDRYGLSEETIGKIQKVFAAFPSVEKAILYGSRAKGTFRNGSDIDLTLIGSTALIKDIYRIEETVDELMLPYTIDLSIYAEIENPNLLDHIKRVGIGLFKR